MKTRVECEMAKWERCQRPLMMEVQYHSQHSPALGQLPIRKLRREYEYTIVRHLHPALTLRLIFHCWLTTSRERDSIRARVIFIIILSYTSVFIVSYVPTRLHHFPISSYLMASTFPLNLISVFEATCWKNFSRSLSSIDRYKLDVCDGLLWSRKIHSSIDLSKTTIYSVKSKYPRIMTKAPS